MKQKSIKRIVILSILLIVMILSISAITYGLYTTVTKVYRVISTQGGDNELFSSNYLVLKPADNTTDDSFYDNVYVKYSSTPSLYLTICNYAQGYIVKHNNNKIVYDLTISLVDDKGALITDDKIISSVSLEYNDTNTTFTSSTYTLSSQVLLGLNATRNVYTIKIDEEYASVVYFKILALTTSDTLSHKGYALEGKISLQAKTASASWSGDFLEDDTYASSPISFSGFNYDMSGEGEGIISLSWDTTKLAINQNFLNKVDIIEKNVDETGEVNYIKFKTGEETFYRVQFFRTSNPEDDETWADIYSYVTFAFSKE